MTTWLDTLLFGIYPYICLAVFFIGSWARFDRDQYTWKSDSSQLLRTGSLRWGSNLFHIGVLFLFFGHTVGMLTPHAVYEPFMTAGAKQLMAMVSGGLFGLFGFVGVSILLHRRLSDPRIRVNSKTSDIVLLLLLWHQRPHRPRPLYRPQIRPCRLRLALFHLWPQKCRLWPLLRLLQPRPPPRHSRRLAIWCAALPAKVSARRQPVTAWLIWPLSTQRPRPQPIAWGWSCHSTCSATTRKSALPWA